MEIQIASFYKFSPLSEQDLERITAEIQGWSTSLGLRGLFIIGNEGLNATFSGARDAVDQAKATLEGWLGEITFKDSYADVHPFHVLTVKRRPEIVTINRPDLVPNGKRRHLNPEEWDKALNDPGTVVVDTRNDYEYRIGHFKNALNPDTEEFGEFPDWVRRSGLAKEQKILIYCTGGIRCEKAILAMEEQGYQNVYQLDGGILNYLEKLPNRNFEGECFVFDYRVAVDQDLKPSKNYRLCPHCGEPAKEKIECRQCGTPEIVCDNCLKEDPAFHTCSKNCAHHFRRGHKSTRVHHDAFRKRRTTASGS